MKKTYHIVEEETHRSVYEIEIPEEIIAQGIDAIYEYWYEIEDPSRYLVETDCRDLEAIDAYAVKSPILKEDN